MTETSQAPRRPVLLVILDGFGSNISARHNAVALASTPNFDHWFPTNPHTVINASGAAVGLPDGQMGNSEVGHMAMGSGVVVQQDMVHIDNKISNGEFFQNPVLHLMGLQVPDEMAHSLLLEALPETRTQQEHHTDMEQLKGAA